MPPQRLTDFEIQKYYQNKPKFSGVYSSNNLSKIKDKAYLIDFDEYESKGAHWIALYVKAKNVTNPDSFGIEHIPKKLKIIGNKNIITNMYRIQGHDSIICGYFCIGFIDLMLEGKILLEYTYLFPPN